MRVTLLCCQSHDLTVTWVESGLQALGHDVETVHRPGLRVADAGTLGYQVADAWSAAPHAVMALDAVAGVAATVATRERSTRLVVRLPRAGRSGDPATTRVEAAVTRNAHTVLGTSAGELERLVQLGATRSRLRVLPEAVDLSSVPTGTEADDPDPVVAVDDQPEAVHDLLRGMAAGRPAVVLDVGSLPDLVAESVSGIVVPTPADVRPALVALSTDSLRRAAMGMGAADRVAACYDTSVVVPALDRLLDAAGSGGVRTAA